MYALMYSVASRGKDKKGTLPSIKELYDRNNLANSSNKEDIVESVIEQQEKAMSWLSKFNITEKK